MQLIKFLPPYGVCNGFQWPLPKGKRPGAWTPRIGHPVLCERGYHLSPVGAGTFKFMTPHPYLAEARGIIADDDKVVCERARLIRPLNWGERESRLFTILCALRVLPIWEKVYPNDDRPKKAIQAAIDYHLLASDAASYASDAAGAAEREFQWLLWTVLAGLEPGE